MLARSWDQGLISHGHAQFNSSAVHLDPDAVLGAEARIDRYNRCRESSMRRNDPDFALTIGAR
jgi:hypothetical protein